MRFLGMFVSWIWCLISTRYILPLDQKYNDKGLWVVYGRGGMERRRHTLGQWRLTVVQVYAILDEVFLAGEIEETSKQVVLTRLEHLDKLD